MIIRLDGNGNKLVGTLAKSDRTTATAMLRAAEYVRMSTEIQQYSDRQPVRSHPADTAEQARLLKSVQNIR